MTIATSSACSRPIEDVVATLEEEIVLGLIYPRERLVEDALMSRFALKRHAVRQVLLRLESIGLVKRGRNIGAIVKSYTIKEVEDLYAVRELLETHCARLVPLPADEEQLSELEDVQHQHDAAIRDNDLRSVFRLNITFHQSLFSLANNAALVEAIRYYAQCTHPIRSVSFTQPDLLEKARSEHWQILAALRAADRERLVGLCREHLTPSRDTYIYALRQKSRIQSS